MAEPDTTEADDGRTESSIETLERRLADQADRQENFQTFLRGRTDPDADAEERFHQDLIEFITIAMSAGDTGLPEVAIALWEQVTAVEQNARRTDDSGGDSSAGPGRSRSCGSGVDGREPAVPDDPAFQ
jgi:hypothetical protein